MTKLSVIIVTKNEAHNIRDCLKSVAFADEIIVFDSGSSDGTPEICREYTPFVTMTSDWPGDGPQKNRALAKPQVNGYYVWMPMSGYSPELAREMRRPGDILITVCRFPLPFHSRYCNKPCDLVIGIMKPIPDYSKDRHAKFTENVVHCHLQYKETIGKFMRHAIHFPFHELHTLLHKMNQYSTQSA